METGLKKEIFSMCCQQLHEILPSLTESQRRKASESVSVEAMKYFIENNAKLSEHLASMTESHERTRKLFRDHIETIEKNAKAMIEFMIKNGIAKLERDPKKGTILVPKSKLATETVAFVNELNEAVRNFYTVVYDIQTDDTIKQASLF